MDARYERRRQEVISVYARNSRTTPYLAAAMMGLGLAGCRSFPADAPARPSRIESFSAVSDRPDSAIARNAPSKPGRISSRVDPPAADPRQPQAVTGRVVDSSGTPVANAKVRLAFDGASGGREVQGVSDRNGAFRLKGLKPDGRYTLIAEWEDSREVLVGRRRVEGSDQEIEIEVRSPDDEGLGLDDSGEFRELSSRQARSNQLFRDIVPGGSANEPDLTADEPAAARLASRRQAAESRVPVARPALAAPAPAGPTWKAGSASERISTARPPVVAEQEADPAPRRAAEPEDVEENPLPPAREPAPAPAPALRDVPTAPDEEFVPAELPKPSPSPSPSPTPLPEPIDAPPVFQPYPANPEVAPPAESEGATAQPIASAGVVPAAPAAGETPLPEPSMALPPDSPAHEASPPAIEPGSGEIAPPADPEGDSERPEIESVPPVIEPLEAEPEDVPSGPPAGAMVPEETPAPPTADPLAELPQEEPPPVSLPTPPDQPIGTSAEVVPPEVASAEPPALPEVEAGTETVSAPPAEIPVVESPAGEAAPGSIPAEGSSQPAVEESPAPEAEAAPAITWNDLPPPGSLRQGPIAQPAAAGTAPVSLAGSRAAGPDGLKRIGAKLLGPWSGDDVQASCRFDPRSQRLSDFVLPDLQGRPFRRSDLQAQNILLVFWGSWSESCVQAISRLNDLQEHHDPSRFQVVAVAYEQAEVEARPQVVGSLARRLGIDFPVLLGATDGTCPLQNALNVQYYPTYLLIDQYGRIQWRGTGGGPDVLARLERAVSTAVHRSSQSKESNAPVARQEGAEAGDPATRVR